MEFHVGRLRRIHERAVTHARIRITNIVGGAIAMSFGEKEFAGRSLSRQRRKGGVNCVMAGRTDPANSDGGGWWVGVCVCATVCVCVRACVRAYVRACVRACVRGCVRAYVRTCMRDVFAIYDNNS